MEARKVGDLDAVEVRHSSGASAVFVLWGGTLVSFKSKDGVERLLLSKKAVLDGSKAVRGGVPPVFPQFGAGPLPNHGFGRTSKWQVKGSPVEVENGERVRVEFCLESTEETRKLWNHEFNLVQTIEFSGMELYTSMQISNTGNKGFEFQALLHSYHMIGDISALEVYGLKDLEYLDQLEDRKEKVELNNIVVFDKEVDRIYHNGSSVVLKDKSRNLKTDIEVRFRKGDQAFDCDVVVWNPWIDKSKRMGDIDDEEYHHFVCIEPGSVTGATMCGAGETFILDQRMKYSSL
mmetsp:Transcript_119/g.278  ORF Transcript_119/g.278 Transcript_119/m.278 type:complete len:291 (+) Transcript_119:111-983(+)